MKFAVYAYVMKH